MRKQSDQTQDVLKFAEDAQDNAIDTMIEEHLIMHVTQRLKNAGPEAEEEVKSRSQGPGYQTTCGGMPGSADGSDSQSWNCRAKGKTR